MSQSPHALSVKWGPFVKSKGSPMFYGATWAEIPLRACPPRAGSLHLKAVTQEGEDIRSMGLSSSYQETDTGSA